MDTSTPTLTSRDVVERAIEILQTCGWTHGSWMADSQGRFCLEGAIYLAAGRIAGLPLRYHIHDPILGPIRALLGAKIFEMTQNPFDNPWSWNDEPNRTVDEVIALLKDVYADLPL